MFFARNAHLAYAQQSCMDSIVEKARRVALEALKDETRYDGESFITHPDNVAKIVSDEIGLNDECCAAV